jgi:hypothetical protein
VPPIVDPINAPESAPKTVPVVSFGPLPKRSVLAQPPSAITALRATALPTFNMIDPTQARMLVEDARRHTPVIERLGRRWGTKFSMKRLAFGAQAPIESGAGPFHNMP